MVIVWWKISSHDSPKDIKKRLQIPSFWTVVYMYSMHSMSMYVGCTWNGVQYEEGATWTDAGQTCSCVGGRVTCRTDDCPKLTPAPCPQDSPGKRKKRNMKDREKNTEALFQTQMGCLCVYIHRLVCYLVNKAITTAMVKVLSIQFRFRNELILYLFSGLTFMGGIFSDHFYN